MSASTTRCGARRGFCAQGAVASYPVEAEAAAPDRNARRRERRLFDGFEATQQRAMSGAGRAVDLLPALEPATGVSAAFDRVRSAA
jgi:hypothetical protein